VDVSLSADYFDRLYQYSPDPWEFRTRWYEERKRRLTLAALLQDRYRSVFEPGCSTGLLTAGLADRSERVVAMDVCDAPLRQAASHLPSHVRLVQGAIPSDWPGGSFELSVLSEVGYYLSPSDCERMAELAVGCSDEVVAVHWRHPVPEYPLSGDAVHGVISDCAGRHGMEKLVEHQEGDLRLDIWSRDRRSVARRTGVPGA
jgi:SAM-dependent methyltransferase